MKKHLLRLCAFLMLFGMVQTIKAADFKNFSVIVNNQTGTLLTAEEQVQGTAVNFGVAVADDGTISRVAADDASSVATISGKFHSEHGCTNLKVVTAVPGAVKILVGQCTYSSNDIVVTNAAGETVATATPAKACWKNDRNNVTELIYKGGATTLTITGPAYCPFVSVEKIDVPQDVTGTWNFGNTDLQDAVMALSGKTESGEIEAVEKNGLKMTVEPNGATFRINGENMQIRSGAVIKIPVKNAGDLITVVGYPGYSYYTIAGGETRTPTRQKSATPRQVMWLSPLPTITTTTNQSPWCSMPRRRKSPSTTSLQQPPSHSTRVPKARKPHSTTTVISCQARLLLEATGALRTRTPTQT